MKLPEHLYAAYEWTDAAGELEDLRAMTGTELATYIAGSVQNFHDSDTTGEAPTAEALNELHDWLKIAALGGDR